MQQTSEVIVHEPHGRDAWVCICGNTPSDAGFYPIDEANHEVEPTLEDWKTGHYACRQCGRVIDPDSLRVVRRIDVSSVVWLYDREVSGMSKRVSTQDLIDKDGNSLLFTPLDANRSKRLEFKQSDVTVLSGSLDIRGVGKKARVRIDGVMYDVYGWACDLPGCQCDAYMVPVGPEVAT